MHYILRRVVPFKLGKSENTKFMLNLGKTSFELAFSKIIFIICPIFIIAKSF